MVQTYPQQTGTATVLPKTASASVMMPSHAQSHSQSQQIVANAQSQRSNYHGMSGQTSYRGSAGPVQPYAFSATPTLANNNNSSNNNAGPWQNYGAFRTNSSPGSVPTVQTLDARPRYQSTQSGGVTQSTSRDDSSLPSASRTNPRQPSPHVPGGSGQPTFAQVAAAKASPDRYRRPAARHADSSPVVQQQHAPQTQGSAMPSGSGMANVVHLYNPRVAGSSRVPRSTASRPQSAYGSLMAGVAVDDMHVNRHTSEEEHNRRFRRRSMASFDTADYPHPMTPQEFKQQQQRADELVAAKRTNVATEKQQKPQKPVTRILPVPTVEKNHAPLHGATTHARNGSSESLASSRSSNSRPSSVSSYFSVLQVICTALSNQDILHRSWPTIIRPLLTREAVYQSKLQCLRPHNQQPRLNHRLRRKVQCRGPRQVGDYPSPWFLIRCRQASPQPIALVQAVQHGVWCGAQRPGLGGCGGCVLARQASDVLSRASQ